MLKGTGHGEAAASGLAAVYADTQSVISTTASKQKKKPAGGRTPGGEAKTTKKRA